MGGGGGGASLSAHILLFCLPLSTFLFLGDGG